MRAELEGQRFGRLIVKAWAGQGKRRQARWLCLCDCGAERTVDAAALKRKKDPTVSCGCKKARHLVGLGLPALEMVARRGAPTEEARAAARARLAAARATKSRVRRQTSIQGLRAFLLRKRGIHCPATSAPQRALIGIPRSASSPP
jgi:hypothetical protein